MKGLALWMLLTMQIANCLWDQQGHWTRSLSANSSFLFTFLGEEGYAQISGDRYSKGLHISLKQSQGSDRRISINLNMVSERYQAVPKFHANNLTAKTIFHSQDGTVYPQQEISIQNNLPFNVTFTVRKQLQLTSSEGVFYIKLIDIEEVSPRIHYYLWLLLALILFLGQPFLLIFYESTSPLELTLGTWSSFLLIAGLVRIIRCIIDQTFYFSDTSYSSNFLEICSFLIAIILAFELLFSMVELQRKRPRAPYSFAIVNIIMTVLLLVTFIFAFIPLRLWHCLTVIVVYEIVTLINKKYECKKDKSAKVVFLVAVALLGILYLFPCFIFPFFAFEIRYPQEEAELWWLYGVFYLVEVAVFLCKSGVCFKLKRLIKLKSHKQFNNQAYLELEEKACPLCLKEVENSEIGLNAAGEAPQVEWIQAECGHHFHKTCVRQNMHHIDCCLFDNTKWTDEFKKAVHK